MGSQWRKVKVALGLNHCMLPTAGLDNDLPPVSSAPATASPSSLSLRFSKSFSRSSKKICTICLGTMKRGDGNAIFTAECSHCFHFHCIASNVKHGNQVCPVCRAKWKDVPCQGPNLDQPPGRARISPEDFPQDNSMMTVIRQLPPRPVIDQTPEPAVFNDDDVLDRHFNFVEKVDDGDIIPSTKVKLKTYPEVPSVPRLVSSDSFTVLVHLKAPVLSHGQDSCRTARTSRAPVDLVTVLDISGSMAGTKLALLKRAMGFVIQNLGSEDRLSVIAFSSTARRLFRLRLMSDAGKRQALLAVNGLAAGGGTNIADGLRKGRKVLEDRREHNPVSNIMLLSDGQDTYNPHGFRNVPDCQARVPVHAFGFGTDHDAFALHSISEASGGTFSFIETEAVIQDAFAQCIGGLLSVVAKDVKVSVECVEFGIHVESIKTGSYPHRVSEDRLTGFVDIGDLYADEERDFLISVSIPVGASSLFKVKCNYDDPIRKENVNVESVEVKIARTETNEVVVVSLEVDRHRIRLGAAEAMGRARAAAEEGNMTVATCILEDFRKLLAETVSAKAKDGLCMALDAELKEMQERMGSRRVYEASGRAYVLSGLSSHSWQRATTRGDSTEGSSLVRSYQTRSMTEMLSQSQATLLHRGRNPI
ncbi:E3 ubiquitin-protein ligase WAV3-like [Impatiens glandulifera]|uniref:E3 ubiquitin-protein ligase WAV3-like n=1 Tax=Impatiens glandulifera TaxID=253017 RepID=UPI001FB11F69|nr:E3 ubiquitin-protein ligase WAV3-like [Impatiens glandulifera]